MRLKQTKLMIVCLLHRSIPTEEGCPQVYEYKKMPMIYVEAVQRWKITGDGIEFTIFLFGRAIGMYISAHQNSNNFNIQKMSDNSYPNITNEPLLDGRTPPPPPTHQAHNPYGNPNSQNNHPNPSFNHPNPSFQNNPNPSFQNNPYPNNPYPNNGYQNPAPYNQVGAVGNYQVIRNQGPSYPVVQNFGLSPNCPICRRETSSITRKSPGGVTWIWCFALFILTGVCCCIPFCVDSCQDTELVCVNCQTVKLRIEANCC